MYKFANDSSGVSAVSAPVSGGPSPAKSAMPSPKTPSLGAPSSPPSPLGGNSGMPSMNSNSLKMGHYRIKRADEQEPEKPRLMGKTGPLAGAALGAMLGARAHGEAPGLIDSLRDLHQLRMPLSAGASDALRDAQHDLRRDAMHAGLRTAGGTLAGAALGAGLDYTTRKLIEAYRNRSSPSAPVTDEGPQRFEMLPIGAEGQKVAFNRSTVYRRKMGPHEFHVEYPEDMSVNGVHSKYDYGYLPGYKNPDGDSADFYLGHDPNGSIARFTKTMPGVAGTADHKFFAGFTPEQLEDYQKNFPEYTHQSGAALTDRKDFKDWGELDSHLSTLRKTGPLTRIQEEYAKRTSPEKVAEEEQPGLLSSIGKPALTATALAAAAALLYGGHRGKKHFVGHMSEPRGVHLRKMFESAKEPLDKEIQKDFLASYIVKGFRSGAKEFGKGLVTAAPAVAAAPVLGGLYGLYGHNARSKEKKEAEPRPPTFTP